MRNTKRVRRLTLALVLAAAARLGTAAEPAAQPLFEDDAPLSVRLVGPFRELARHRAETPELPATLHYRAGAGAEVVLDVGIRPRGISRLRHCTFPPLRLDFDLRAPAGTLFEGQDALKLVTHCMRSPVYGDYIGREYQIYRLYNLLTDHSFRVRWLSIEYVDTDADSEPFTAPAFVIEEDWAAAARLGMEAVEVETVAIEELDPAAAALMAVFQFVVGNVDWSVRRGPPGEPCCHNGKVLAVAGQAGGRIVLPYDFDQAGFVDADYAVHNESQGLTGEERLYRGFCAFNSGINAAIARVTDAGAQALALVASEPVRERAGRRGVRYLESGLEIIADPRDVERQLIGRCRADGQ